VESQLTAFDSGVFDDTKIEKLVGANSQESGVAVLGLAFKPETDDMRDAPSVDIVRGLIARGAIVVAYDPAACRKRKECCLTFSCGE